MRSSLAGLMLLLWPLAARAENRGVAVSVSPLADRVARQAMARGGNGVDAAVAMSFALAVTWPEAGNIGGGGFMLIRPPGAKSAPVVIDYREKAPAAATRDLFARGIGSAHRTVGVPGTVAGLALAHAKFGKLPWKDLVAPAVQLGEEGFVVDASLAKSLNGGLARAKGFAEFRRIFGKTKWSAGDRLVQKDLARTLRRIAERGADGFYKGETADLLVGEMRAGAGLITKKDLEAYRAKLREPIHGTYRGHDVYAPPPPSSGGICLVEMLNVLEAFDLKKNPRYSARTLHLMAEAMRRAYCDRARHLGDQDFVKVPAQLTSKDYARRLAGGISLEKATPSEEIARDIPLRTEGDSTTHFSVIDNDGMAVSNTYTLERSYGSRIVVRGAGFLLNNEMMDFNWFPGQTLRDGTIGTEANLVAPGKRMLSSQTPTIVARDGKVFLVTGSPGSRSIINTVLNILVNVIDFRMGPRQAVDAPRLHHQWFPDQLHFEGGEEYAASVTALEALGHRVTGTSQGDAHTIGLDSRTGMYVGAADRRINGKVASF